MIDPFPTEAEVAELIARFKKQADTWRGNPGYVRGLLIEIHALQLLQLTLPIIVDESIPTPAPTVSPHLEC